MWKLSKDKSKKRILVGGMNDLKNKIENITGDEIDTARELKVFKELYLHGYLNKDSPPMNSKKLLSMGRTLGLDDFAVLDSKDYLNRLKKFTEPKNCIIFIENENSNIGHFTAAYTDEDGIHYSDSLGSSNSKKFINNMKSTGRDIHIANSTAYQNNKTSNCGYLSLLFLVSHTHSKVKQTM